VAGVLCLTSVNTEGDADVSIKMCCCSKVFYSVKVAGTLDVPVS